MNPPPKTFVRLDDDERFTINPDGTYSNEVMKRDYPGHLHHAWGLDIMEALCRGESATFRAIPCKARILTSKPL